MITTALNEFKDHLSSYVEKAGEQDIVSHRFCRRGRLSGISSPERSAIPGNYRPVTGRCAEGAGYAAGGSGVDSMRYADRADGFWLLDGAVME
uniref:Uncharacterized protein n=1 Tax=Candidatus Kentrum sp. LPFa TaxID=2126335 RepID=A0A450WFN8_9GAMM|nr:MAG: hypothetical protein BECKLPF1236A_GA0070988_1013315 [Candidatus Kentron sp. LPFa]VFK31539.1 MAG: hypothetical protein BECKLPF1236C_GA0070990_1014115 [Candidatus Kentron sp. LPFa]